MWQISLNFYWEGGQLEYFSEHWPLFFSNFTQCLPKKYIGNIPIRHDQFLPNLTLSMFRAVGQFTIFIVVLCISIKSKFFFTKKCTFYLTYKMLKFTLKYLIFTPTCFGPFGCTLHCTQYRHHNLKHMLPQHCITYNDVSLLIISTKV